jgi:hypothetical protein
VDIVVTDSKRIIRLFNLPQPGPVESAHVHFTHSLGTYLQIFQAGLCLKYCVHVRIVFGSSAGVLQCLPCPSQAHSFCKTIAHANARTDLVTARVEM